MSLYLDNIRSYSHCPLKKRPLHVMEESLSDAFDEPQDLRVKRRREEDLHPPPEDLERHPIPPPEKLSSSFVTPPDQSSQSVAFPSDPFLVTATSAMPERPPQIPPLADFYLQLFHSTAYQRKKQLSSWKRVWPILSTTSWGSNPPKVSSSVVKSTASPESHLSSPRSTSSEDSGVGNEFVSEDELDVISVAAAGGTSPCKHTCHSCRKTYSTSSGLRKHLELHCSSVSTRTFECKHCSKAYTSVGALKMHIRTHTLPCKCNVCGKAFSRPWLLQGHIRTHTGEKPFECHQCHRSFADRSNLRAHQQTHQRVKKYACSACNKTFSRMSLLNKHSENSCPRNACRPIE